MEKLTILYDPSCSFCVRCRWWLARQPSFLTLEFIPADAQLLRERYPTLNTEKRAAELIVIGDDSIVYREDDAWIMCLYALREYREWSLRLSDPTLRPLAGAFFRQLSKRRHVLSRMLSAPLPDESKNCPEGTCHL